MNQILLISILAVLSAAPVETQHQTIKDLRHEIQELKVTIQSLQKQLNALKADLEKESAEKMRLVLLCRVHGIDTSPKPPVNPEPTDNKIVYRGKERTKEWFEKMYERFYDKIVHYHDEYIPRKTFASEWLYQFPPDAEVRQVLDFGEGLVWSEGRMLHVQNAPALLFDGQPLLPCYPCDGWKIAGVHRYLSVAGSVKTIPSYEPYYHKPITKAQFAECLRSGFVLIYPSARRPVRIR